MNKVLVNPPLGERERELWMQHGAGYIIFENIRKYAINQIPLDATGLNREAYLKGIDNTIYGMMMQMDGVFDSLENEKYRLELQTNIVLFEEEEVIEELNTIDGDGMCMGFHGWIKNDFGQAELLIDND